SQVSVPSMIASPKESVGLVSSFQCNARSWIFSVQAGPGRSPSITWVWPLASISVKRPTLKVFSRIPANSIPIPLQIGASLIPLLPAGQVVAAAALPGIFAGVGGRWLPNRNGRAKAAVPGSLELEEGGRSALLLALAFGFLGLVGLLRLVGFRLLGLR